MDSYPSFENLFNMGLSQTWQQIIQQQLQLQLQQRHQQQQQLEHDQQLPVYSYPTPEWMQQQQHAIVSRSSTWHPPQQQQQPPSNMSPIATVDETLSVVDDPAAAAAAEASLKWRHLPASLRRRAGAQAASALLKAWMRQHADNPYPSKNEKSALAALTNMSFAQISTWFANARRRLKKDMNCSSASGNRSSRAGAFVSVAHRATDASSKPRIWSIVETAMKEESQSPADAVSTAVASGSAGSDGFQDTCWQHCRCHGDFGGFHS